MEVEKEIEEKKTKREEEIKQDDKWKVPIHLVTRAEMAASRMEIREELYRIWKETLMATGMSSAEAIRFMREREGIVRGW